MEEQHYQQQPVTPAKRPVSLTIICVLTFIWSSLTFISCLFIPANADAMIRFATLMPDMKGLITEESMVLLRAGWGYYLSMFLLTSVSLTGAIMMWNLRKNGFHLYAIANIFAQCLPSFLLGVPFSIGILIFPGIFIGMYAIHLRFMN